MPEMLGTRDKFVRSGPVTDLGKVSEDLSSFLGLGPQVCRDGIHCRQEKQSLERVHLQWTSQKEPYQHVHTDPYIGSAQDGQVLGRPGFKMTLYKRFTRLNTSHVAKP